MNSLIRSALSPEDCERFVKAKTKSKDIVPLLVKLLRYKYDELDKPTAPSDMENPSWPLQRAYKDGGRYQLSTLIKLFEEK